MYMDRATIMNELKYHIDNETFEPKLSGFGKYRVQNCWKGGNRGWDWSTYRGNGDPSWMNLNVPGGYVNLGGSNGSPRWQNIFNQYGQLEIPLRTSMFGKKRRGAGIPGRRGKRVPSRGNKKRKILKGRAMPAASARDFKVGTKRRGLDGKMWSVRGNSKYKTWGRVSASKGSSCPIKPASKYSLGTERKGRDGKIWVVTRRLKSKGRKKEQRKSHYVHAWKRKSIKKRSK